MFVWNSHQKCHNQVENIQSESFSFFSFFLRSLNLLFFLLSLSFPKQFFFLAFTRFNLNLKFHETKLLNLMGNVLRKGKNRREERESTRIQANNSKREREKNFGIICTITPGTKITDRNCLFVFPSPTLGKELGPSFLCSLESPSFLILVSIYYWRTLWATLQHFGVCVQAKKNFTVLFFLSLFCLFVEHFSSPKEAQTHWVSLCVCLCMNEVKFRQPKLLHCLPLLCVVPPDWKTIQQMFDWSKGKVLITMWRTHTGHSELVLNEPNQIKGRVKVQCKSHNKREKKGRWVK